MDGWDEFRILTVVFTGEMPQSMVELVSCLIESLQRRGGSFH